MFKSGDKAIATVLRRSSKGLELNIKVHEAVEEFFRAAAGQETTPIELYGRKWVSSTPLTVHDLPESMRGSTVIGERTAYRLDKPGHDLIFTDDLTRMSIINMGFIRLVGASAPEGVTFTLAGAYEREDVIRLSQEIANAGNVFVRKYVYPMIISMNNIVTVVPGGENGLQEVGG
jgi:hypothetical protein